jgi:hypothetical protein
MSEDRQLNKQDFDSPEKNIKSQNFSSVSLKNDKIKLRNLSNDIDQKEF